MDDFLLLVGILTVYGLSFFQEKLPSPDKWVFGLVVSLLLALTLMFLDDFLIKLELECWKVEVEKRCFQET